MSQWSSKFAFLQDLAEVTSGQLPGDSDEEDNIIADEMEEFLQQGACASLDSELLKGPDLSSLKELLSMVKQENFIESEELDEGVITISKLSAINQPCVPKTKETPVEIPFKAPKIINQRNIAIISIMEILKLEAKTENALNHEKKPENTTKPGVSPSCSSPLPQNPESALPQITKANGPILRVSMFKKKLSPKKEEERPLENDTPSFKTKTFVPPELHSKSAKTKPPSIWDGRREDKPVNPSGKSAEKKLVIKTNLVWNKIDMELKKKDENEMALNMLCSLNLKAFKDGVIDRLASIGLAQHRHGMDAECVVCKVLCAPK